MSLVIPGMARPSNLHLPEDASAIPVSSDLYDICNRIKAISPRLYVILIDFGTHKGYNYAVMEHCEDNVDRLVFRCEELDDRVLKRLRHLMALPLDVRLVELEKEETRKNEELEENAFEELYERFGRPMWTELERCGFIQRRTSYAKRGVKATNVK